jgi:ketosteroid isomerase-like protein
MEISLRSDGIKKEDLMYKGLVMLLCLIIIVACGGERGPDERESQKESEAVLAQKSPDLKKEREILMETDRLFAKASEEKGFGEAFDLFTSDEARVFQNKLKPIVGKDAIVKFMTENVRGKITWEPYFVEISASGDLGYTLGKSQSTSITASGKETVSYGHYVTIWKKQPDGSWKLVFDSGIETPK